MAYSWPESLADHHELAGFDCGESSLNSWLRRHARQAEAGRTARVFVSSDGSRVVGFYALAAAGLSPARAPERLRKGAPAHQPIPVILLARLAVDSEHQGRGLGRSLLQQAMIRSETAAESIGAKALVVHAMNAEARGWYVKAGFEPAPSHPLHLLLLMKDVQALLRSGPS